MMENLFITIHASLVVFVFFGIALLVCVLICNEVSDWKRNEPYRNKNKKTLKKRVSDLEFIFNIMPPTLSAESVKSYTEEQIELIYSAIRRIHEYLGVQERHEASKTFLTKKEA